DLDEGFRAVVEVGRKKVPARDYPPARLEDRPRAVTRNLQRAVLLADQAAINNDVNQNAKDHHRQRNYGRPEQRDARPDWESTAELGVILSPASDPIQEAAYGGEKCRCRCGTVDGGAHSSFKMYPTPRTVCSKRGRPLCSSFCRT